MDKIEGNKMIANFRYPMWKEEFDSGNIEMEGVMIKSILYAEDYDQLRYDSSWEWLMPIVEFIMEYKYPDYWGGSTISEEDKVRYDDHAYPRTFGMRDEAGRYMVRFNANTLCFGDTFKEAVWNAVIDFITWFNANKIPKNGNTGKDDRMDK